LNDAEASFPDTTWLLWFTLLMFSNGKSWRLGLWFCSPRCSFDTELAQ